MPCAFCRRPGRHGGSLPCTPQMRDARPIPNFPAPLRGSPRDHLGDGNKLVRLSRAEGRGVSRGTVSRTDRGSSDDSRRLAKASLKADEAFFLDGEGILGKRPPSRRRGRDGASEGIRTLDIHLGKVTLYQAELRSLPAKRGKNAGFRGGMQARSFEIRCAPARIGRRGYRDAVSRDSGSATHFTALRRSC